MHALPARSRVHPVPLRRKSLRPTRLLGHALVMLAVAATARAETGKPATVAGLLGIQSPVESMD